MEESKRVREFFGVAAPAVAHAEPMWCPAFLRIKGLGKHLAGFAIERCPDSEFHERGGLEATGMRWTWESISWIPRTRMASAITRSWSARRSAAGETKSSSQRNYPTYWAISGKPEYVQSACDASLK